MLVSIKTLEGKLFKIEAAPELSIEQVKELIEKSNPDMPARAMKLIHSGKVLKDSETLAEKGVTESSFLVCMVTKSKRTPTRAPASAAPAPPASSSHIPPTPTPHTPPAAHAPAPATPAAAAAPATTTTAAASLATPEALAHLDAMGFGHEEQSRAALEAAMGNIDLAVEFLMNGIPDELPRPSSLEALRNHPQFEDLRRSLQQNPGSLEQAFQTLHRDNPDLLALIQANQAEFLQMINEPAQQPSSAGDEDEALARVMASITPQQRAQLAANFGLTPEQFDQFARQMQNMPRDQLRQFIGVLANGSAIAGHAARRNDVVRLTREEADAVNRLAELGFSRDDAAQAYLACDKNEALAANLLFDGFEANRNFGNASSNDQDQQSNNAMQDDDDDDDDDDDAMYS